MRAEPIVPIANEAGWPIESFEQLCSLIARGTAPQYVERSEVHAIGQRCVTAAGFVPYFARPHSARAMHGVLAARTGDVLLNSTGTGTIGRSCMFLSDETFIVDGHVTVLRPQAERCDGRWLNALLRSPWGQSFLETQCYAGSTNQVELSRTLLAAGRAPVPSPREQRQIAAILDTIDDAIRKTEQIIAKLKQVKQGLLRDLLTRGIDDNGELRDLERHPQQFKDSPLGRIPRAWEVKPLEACVNPLAPITYGIVQAGPHVADGIPYIRTGDMSGDRLEVAGLRRTSPRVAASYARSRVEAHEIVCAIRATVGKVLPVPPELDGANLTQGTARIAPGTELCPGFLLWALRGQASQRQFDMSVKGTTFREITLRELRRLLVPVPSRREEQNGIALALQTALEREESELAARDKLRLMKAGLMEDLLTGRVRVTKRLEPSLP